MSNWQVASPVMRLAVLASILHLGLNLWIQPAASRELRETMTNASTDIAATLVREGMFMTHEAGLTTFASGVTGSQMSGLLVSDTRNPAEPVTFFSKSAFLTEMEGAPVLVLKDGHRQTLRENGAMEAVYFDQSPLDLSPFLSNQKALILEESDRFLPELFFPDTSNYYDHQNVNMLLAEGHQRISAPLLNMAMALLAIYAVLGGDFSRRGYTMRIGLASAAALMLRLAAFGAVAAGRDDPSLNWLQYALPVVMTAAISFFFFIKTGKAKHTRRYVMLRQKPQAA
jgi:lipopolysaccharide export system permease protein